MEPILSPETERLAEEVAEIAGESKDEAIRKALEERKLQMVARGGALNPQERAAKLRRFLEEKVWPSVPPEVRGKRLTKEEEEEILGFGPGGV